MTLQDIFEAPRRGRLIYGSTDLRNATSVHIKEVLQVQEKVVRFLSVAESSLYSEQGSVNIFRTCFQEISRSKDLSLIRIVSTTLGSFICRGIRRGTWHDTPYDLWRDVFSSRLSQGMINHIQDSISKIISSQKHLREVYRASDLLDKGETGVWVWARDLGFVPQVSLSSESEWELWLDELERLPDEP